MDIITAGQLAGALTTIGALLAPASWWVYGKVTRASAILHAIEAEFRPNGGGTLRDAINRLEQQVERLHAIKHLMIDQSGTASFETTENGDCTWVSVGYLDLVDRPIEDVRGSGWSIVIHQDDRAHVFAEWRRVVTERRRFELSFRYITRGGEVVPVHVVAVPIPGGYYGVVTPRDPN